MIMCYCYYFSSQWHYLKTIGWRLDFPTMDAASMLPNEYIEIIVVPHVRQHGSSVNHIDLIEVITKTSNFLTFHNNIFFSLL